MDDGLPTDPLAASSGPHLDPRVRWLAAAIVFAGTAFAALRMLNLFRYSVDVPYWDQWNFVDFLRVTDDGVSWSELWAPHNEHRGVVPNVVLLVLARATNWNVRAEIATVHLLVLARFALVWAVVWRIGKRAGVAAWASAPLLAAFLLTRAQAENLLWGWQVTLTLGALFTLVACLLLVNGGWARFGLAAITAVASELSFASGVALWLVGIPFLLLQPGVSRRTRLVRSGLWLATGGILTLLYNRNLPHSPKTGPVTLHDLVEYSVKFLGAPLAPYRDTAPAELIAWRAGWFGIIVFAVGTAGVAFTGQFHRWSPIVMWGLTAPMTAVVTALGRLGFVPVVQSMSSRYVTMSAPLWAAGSVLSIAALLQGVRRIGLAGRARSRSRRVATVAGALTVTLLAFATVSGADGWERWSRRRQQESLRDRAYLADESQLTPEHKVLLFPDPAMIDKERPYLLEERLTLFRSRPR